MATAGNPWEPLAGSWVSGPGQPFLANESGGGGSALRPQWLGTQLGHGGAKFKSPLGPNQPGDFSPDPPPPTVVPGPLDPGGLSVSPVEATPRCMK